MTLEKTKLLRQSEYDWTTEEHGNAFVRLKSENSD